MHSVSELGRHADSNVVTSLYVDTSSAHTSSSEARCTRASEESMLVGDTRIQAQQRCRANCREEFERTIARIRRIRESERQGY